MLCALQADASLIASSPGPKLQFTGSHITERSARISLSVSSHGENAPDGWDGIGRDQGGVRRGGGEEAVKGGGRQGGAGRGGYVAG